jgi:phosphate-selective porin
MQMKKLFTSLLLIPFLLAATQKLHAQETTPPPTDEDTIGQAIRKLQGDVAVLKRIKFSGYVQPQLQFIDSAGAPSFEGGDFPSGVNKRFRVRRAEFKTMYDNGKTQIVANIDITQSGVGIKDAYGRFTEQKLQAFSLTAGIFNRPFGWECPTSGSIIESPDRSRIVQTLFPGERDLGMQLTFQMPVSSKLHPLKIEGGMFNGNGNSSTQDYDFQKDFIGHITWISASKNENITYGIGASYYSGGIVNSNKFVWNKIGVIDTTGKIGWMVDSTSTNKGQVSARQYIGFDAQFSINWMIGITTIRGEFISGQQPGSSSSSKSPDKETATPPAADTYVRQFSGGNVYFAQNIWTTKWQVLVKYDWYDPNTQVSGTQIGKAGSKLTKADIKYTTIGLGLIYHLDNNVKIVAYYDMVTNESTSLGGYTKDILDNVFTLRLQYKF